MTFTNTYYEYVGEHDNYVAAFDGASRLSLICSAIHWFTLKILPACVLQIALGMEQACYSVVMVNPVHQKSKPLAKIAKTTTDYYIHNLGISFELPENMQIYLELIGESFRVSTIRNSYRFGDSMHQGMLLEGLNVEGRFSVRTAFIWLPFTLQDLEVRL